MTDKFPKVTSHRFISLIEMLIAVSLTTILLSLLAYFFRDFDLLNTYSEKLQTESFYTRYTQNRLAAVFSTTQPEYKSDEPFFFFTGQDHKGLLSDSPSLIFVFNNGPNDAAGDLQLARLFVNKEKQLCLASWSIAKKWREDPNPSSGHQEILMEDVEKISFSFYAAPEKDRKLISDNLPKGQKETSQIQAPNDLWLSEWRQEYRHLPPLMKIFIHKKSTEKTDKSEPIQFSYVLPLSQKLLVNENSQ